MTPVKRKSKVKFYLSEEMGHCLLCSEEISSSSDGSGKRRRARLVDIGVNIVGGEDCRMLVNRLEEMFILLKVLDVPREWCEQVLLKQGGAGGEGVGVCRKCLEESVGRCWEIHQLIVKLEGRMGVIKRKIRAAMRTVIVNCSKRGRSLEDQKDTLNHKIKELLFPELFPEATPWTFATQNGPVPEEPVKMKDPGKFEVSASFGQVKLDSDLGAGTGPAFEDDSSHLFIDDDHDDYQPLDNDMSNEIEAEAGVSNNDSSRGNDITDDSKVIPNKKKKRIRKKRSPDDINQPIIKWKFCRTCGTSFDHLEEYDAHQLVHEQLGLAGEFICTHCKFPGRNSQELNDHLANCYKVKLNRMELKVRRRKYSKGFDCPRCPLSTQIWDHLKEHVDLRHPNMTEEEEQAAGLKLTCEMCGSSEYLKSGGDLTCSGCTFPLRSADELEFKLRKKNEEVMKLREDKKMFHCTKCPLRFDKWRKLVSHVNLEHPSMTPEELEEAGIILKCYLCDGREFGNYERWRLHNWRVHPEIGDGGEDGGGGPLICPECGMKFASKKLLDFHMDIDHLREKTFVCDECGKGFNMQTRLNKHKQSHLDRSLRHKIICDLCGLDFIDPKSLRKHNAKCHPKDSKEQGQGSSSSGTGAGKIFKCRYCDLESHIDLVIKRHMKTHIEEMGNRCDQCGKHYSSQQGLSRHIRINHSNQTWFCPHCSKQFVCEEYVKEHVKRYCQVKKLEEVETVESKNS